jgi:hypothetical protein
MEFHEPWLLLPLEDELSKAAHLPTVLRFEILMVKPVKVFI